MEHWQKLLIGFVCSCFSAAVLYPIFRFLLPNQQGKKGREYDNISRMTPASSWPLKVKSVLSGGQRISKMIRERNNKMLDDKTKLSDEDEWQEEEETAKLISEQRENMVYDEYESFTHDCIVAIANDSEKYVGICLFLLDRQVEYFVEDFAKDDKTKYNSLLALKSTLSGISHWSDQWYSAESVNLLCKDKNVVLNLNNPESPAAEVMSDLANLNCFKIYCQWTDNFMCDTVS